MSQDDADALRDMVNAIYRTGHEALLDYTDQLERHRAYLRGKVEGMRLMHTAFRNGVATEAWLNDMEAIIELAERNPR